MAVPWVVDRGLIRLRDQVNEAAPNRSKASDGFIGDPAHQATESDHNPEHPPPAGNPDYEVDAGDLTHDPAHGADMGVVSESIRVSKDPRVSYVIFNRRIFSGPDGPQPWVWRIYSGTSPHTEHMHVSVRDVTHDQTQDWKIGLGMTDIPADIPNLVRAIHKVVTSTDTKPAAWKVELDEIKAMVTALETGTGLDPEALKALIREVLQEQIYTVRPVTTPAP
jgi:hypothetical protein